MKKKAIEKIPPLPVEKTTDKMRFVAAVLLTEIKGEKILIIDFYRNLKKAFKEPLVRVCLTKKDAANYCFDTADWNYNNIDNTNVRDKYFLSENTVSMKPEDEKMVIDFTETPCKRDSWKDAILYMQREQRSIDYQKREEIKGMQLIERIHSMPAVPEKFYQWCEEELFKNCNYIFYSRKGRFAEFHCGVCGQSYKYATEPLDTYEGQFEHIVQVPRQGQYGRCEKCDARGTYKHINRSKTVSDKRCCYLIQKFGNKGAAVVRYFEIYKESEPDKIPVYIDCEINRSFFEPDKVKIQKDYHVYNGFIGVNEWTPNNIPGLATISVRPGRLYTENLDELTGTVLEHSGIEIYEKEYDIFKVEAYMEAFKRMPALEMIVKLGMYYLASRLVEEEYGAWNTVNCSGGNAAEILMIDKTKIKRLQRNKGAQYSLELLQMEKRMGISLSDELEEDLELLALETGTLRVMLECMSARQIINRTLKYAGVAELTEDLCSHAFSHVRATARMYGDYIYMCKTAGYDMTNSIIVHPKNLKENHNKLVRETNGTETQRRITEVNEKYFGVKEKYGELLEHYGYEDEMFIIRPAMDAGEIVLEGRTLHHCVGGNGYIFNHHKGGNIILFLRPVAEKQIPYITIEISGHRIIQWYGLNNSKPDKEKISKWLKNYTEKLKLGILHQEPQARTA